MDRESTPEKTGGTASVVAVEKGTELGRDLGVFAVFTTATGTMIGAGIFVLPGPAVAGAGPAAALSFGIAGLIALVATACAVELATAMPRAGGPYFFTSRAMGPLVGTVIGLGSWFALVFKGSFALVGLGQYVRFFSPVPILAVVLVGGAVLLVVNLVGAKESGRLQNAVVVGLVVLLAAFAGRGLLAVETGGLSPFVTRGWEGVASTTGLVFISYLGIVKATAVAEEVKDPGTTLPRALLGSVVFVTGLYIVVMLVIVGIVPVEQIADSNTAVATAGEQLLGIVGGLVVAFAGILATVSTGNAAILSASRFPFAMARDGLASASLQETSGRFGTPTVSIALTGLLMLGLPFGFDVEQLAKLGGTFGILVFATLNVTVVLLRYTRPDWYDPAFRIPLSPVLPLTGAAAALFLIPFMGTLSQVTAVGFVLTGVGWYVVQRRIGRSVEPEYDLRDQLHRVQYVRALEDKQAMANGSTDTSKIVVEVVEGEPNRDLLGIVEAFAERLEAELEVVVVAEVPPQLSLSRHRLEAELDEEWVQKMDGRLDAIDRPTTFDYVAVRDRTDAILDRVTDDTELVVVDWHDPIRKHHLRESHVDELLRMGLPARLAVLRHRGGSAFQDIVIATENAPFDRAEVELADAIAAHTGGTLTLLKVIPEDPPEQRVSNARDYLDGLTELVESPTETVLVRSDSVVETLIDRGDEADLLVLGPPTHPDRLHDVFGQTTDAVAAETDASVLVAKEEDTGTPWYRRAWRLAIGR